MQWMRKLNDLLFLINKIVVFLAKFEDNFVAVICVRDDKIRASINLLYEK